MKVIKYLKEHGLDKLSDEYKILVKKYDNLIVLNYRQTCSKKLKFNEIVKECRGLILDYDFNVVSRSFDRFFNFHELLPEQQERFKDQNYFKTLKFYEKIDGSLIKIYNFRDVWYISTRKTAFAEESFKDSVLKALKVTDDSSFQNLCNTHFEKNRTYIFELTSPLNKIVTPYDGYTLWLLATRQNDDNDDDDGGVIEFPENLKDLIPGIDIPPIYTFSSIAECFESVDNLPNLKEGFVVCDEKNIPILKIKSKTYLKIHNQNSFNNKNNNNNGDEEFKNENGDDEEEEEEEFENENGELYLKRIIRLIATGEYEEYISYFPEKKIQFEPYLIKIDKYFEEGNEIYNKLCETFPSDSEYDEVYFDLNLLGFPFYDLASQAKKMNKKCLLTVYNELDDDEKEKFLLKCVFQPTMIICVGISASGKSKYATELSQKYGYVDINRDNIRFSSSPPLFPGVTGWNDYKITSENEEKVTKKCLEIWKRAKLERKNVIISDCNLKYSYQEEWRKRGIENLYKVEMKYFHITIEEAWKNDMRRGNRAVGREVIIRQYQKWLKTIGCRKYKPNLEKPKAIVCDIDGTIALATKRNIFHYTKVLYDEPRECIIDIIQTWAAARKYQIVFVSGRESYCFNDTCKWIRKHTNVQDFKLYMRRENDYRKDREVKEGIFWEFIANDFNVVAVFDDRPQVVRMWHDIGIENVFNVQKGYHEF